jgi:putative ABC transport system ATP-binding protein
MVGLTETVFEAGMRNILETGTPKHVAEKLVKARNKFRNAVSQESCFDAVEFFDIESFNTNATVIENLLFYELCDKSIDHIVLAKDPDIRQIFENNNLLKPLIEIGHIATSNIVKLFRGLPSEDEKLNHFSLIRPEDLPLFESLLHRVPQIEGIEIDDTDRSMLLFGR